MSRIVIKTLEEKKEQILKERNEAMMLAAEPFNVQLAELNNGIAYYLDMEKEVAANNITLSTPKPVAKRGRQPRSVIPLFEVYPLEGSIIERLVHILRESGKFLSMAQVAERVKQYQPEENEVLLKEKFGKHTVKYKAAGHIVTIGTRRSILYGLPEWLDENKKPLDEYMPKSAIEILGAMAKQAMKSISDQSILQML